MLYYIITSHYNILYYAACGAWRAAGVASATAECSSPKSMDWATRSTKSSEASPQF